MMAPARLRSIDLPDINLKLSHPAISVTGACLDVLGSLYLAYDPLRGQPDGLSEQRLGACGIVLILCGFALQSFKHGVPLFDLRVT